MNYISINKLLLPNQAFALITQTRMEFYGVKLV